MLRIRFITDLCELLLLFVLGHQSPPGQIFQSTAQEGLHKDDYAQRWIVKHQSGELIVAGKEEADAI
jgi:frataxin-like iron-binding protein CyaY